MGCADSVKFFVIILAFVKGIQAASDSKKQIADPTLASSSPSGICLCDVHAVHEG